MRRVRGVTPADVSALAIDLQALERRCYDLGLLPTAHAINRATQRLGYDAADRIAAIARAGMLVTQSEKP